MQTTTILDFVRLVVEGTDAEVARRLKSNPELAEKSAPIGATRLRAKPFFFTSIRRYLYAGDTGLHMAAAASRRSVAELLVGHGAAPRARNRRGAEPLHYAADGNSENPESQAEIIRYLISVGADVNAVDNAGVAPLHRAVRARALYAVQALLELGANPRQPNKSGSFPLHMAVQNTGRSGSGLEAAHRHQAGIIKLLLEHGARLTDRNRRGKPVHEAATSDWVRRELEL